MIKHFPRGVKGLIEELTLSHIEGLTPRRARTLLKKVESQLRLLPTHQKKRGRPRMATHVIPTMLANDANLIFYMKLLMSRNDLLKKLGGGDKQLKKGYMVVKDE